MPSRKERTVDKDSPAADAIFLWLRHSSLQSGQPTAAHSPPALRKLIYIHFSTHTKSGPSERRLVYTAKQAHQSKGSERQHKLIQFKSNV
ncbi:hypothetical protein EXN66_Car007117 [Channa argus]|uniref:Uncharacterized protein n=1 Tax=Channa argus TaxID=215402 RepID=A0A6G1PMF4_CHAAH|nr:hypothetical protein EXN66_Car007117 [Channa argus]